MSRDRRGVHARECLRADVPAAARREGDGRVGRRARSPPARAGRGAIDYDCAHGSLAGPLRTDGEARFVTTGFYVREHGGPIREGEPIDSVPATYLGSVVGDRMTLRAVVGTDTLGPFVLQRDATHRSSASVSERRTPVGRPDRCVLDTSIGPGHYAIRAPGASAPCLSRYQTRAVNLISMSCVGRARRDVVTIVLATAGRSDP